MIWHHLNHGGDIVWLQFDPQASHEQAGHEQASFKAKVSAAVLVEAQAKIKALLGQ